MARTLKLRGPSGSVVYWRGDVQTSYADESSEHSKVDPASLDVNSNVALVEIVVAGGAAVIVVFGAVVSGGMTVHA
jgi:hypothetical protein